MGCYFMFVGFVEFGELLEDVVCCEVVEEVGVCVDEVYYYFL